MGQTQSAGKDCLLILKIAGVWSPYDMVAVLLLLLLLYLYNVNVRKEYGNTTVLSMRSKRKFTACRSP